MLQYFIHKVRLGKSIKCRCTNKDITAHTVDLIIIDKPEIVHDVNYSSNLGASDDASITIDFTSSLINLRPCKLCKKSFI